MSLLNLRHAGIALLAGLLLCILVLPGLSGLPVAAYAVCVAGLLCIAGLAALVLRLEQSATRLAQSSQLMSERAGALERLSIDLRQQIGRRRTAQAELQRHRDDLEREVKKRTMALVASEARLAEAVETLPEGFVWFDANDRLVICNEAFRNISPEIERLAKPGISYAELTRMAAQNGLYAPIADLDAWVEDRIKAHQSVGREPVRSEYRTAQGRWIEVQERRTRDGGVVGLRMDVTDARRREASLAEHDKLAALGQLAGGVAHEINNLLQPALTFPELVRDRLPAEDQESREDLDLVLDSVRRAREIVKNILTFARKQDVTIETVDLPTEVAAALKFVAELLPPRITLRPRIELSSIPAAVNRTQLTQVLTNLIINAVHATADRGAVEVRVGKARPAAAQTEALGLAPNTDYVTIAVADEGCGMDAATLQRIFEPFFTTKPQGQGTGLGLSVVFGILKSWDGAVGVESTVGKGTTFTLYIPVAARQSAALAA